MNVTDVNKKSGLECRFLHCDNYFNPILKREKPPGMIEYDCLFVQTVTLDSTLQVLIK